MRFPVQQWYWLLRVEYPTFEKLLSRIHVNWPLASFKSLHMFPVVTDFCPRDQLPITLNPLRYKRWFHLNEKINIAGLTTVHVNLCHSKYSLWQFYLFNYKKTEATEEGVLCSRQPVVPFSIHAFILARSVKWVLGTPEDAVVKSKPFPRSGFVALRQVNLIHKKGLWSFSL